FVARLESTDRVAMQTHRVPLLELTDLVLDLDPGAAVDEDVDLLLLLVLVPEGDPEPRRHPEIAEPGVLEPEWHAGHASLEIRRQAEVRCLVVDIVFEVDVCVVGHGADCTAATVRRR